MCYLRLPHGKFPQTRRIKNAAFLLHTVPSGNFMSLEEFMKQKPHHTTALREAFKKCWDRKLFGWGACGRGIDEMPQGVVSLLWKTYAVVKCKVTSWDKLGEFLSPSDLTALKYVHIRRFACVCALFPLFRHAAIFAL